MRLSARSQFEIGSSYAARRRRDVCHPGRRVSETGSVRLIISECAKVEIGLIESGVPQIRITEQRAVKIGFCEIGTDQAAADKLRDGKLCFPEANAIKMEPSKICAGAFVCEPCTILAVGVYPTPMQVKQAPQRVRRTIRVWSRCHFGLSSSHRIPATLRRSRRLVSFAATPKYSRSVGESICSRVRVKGEPPCLTKK